MKNNTKIFDIHIGHKIKQRRQQLNLSQSDLGKALGVSAQQVQRYESGENSLAVDRLLHISSILNVKTNYFLDDVDGLKSKDASKADDIIIRDFSRPLHILLVEDDTNDVILFQQALKENSLNVELFNIQKSDKVMDYLDNHNSKYNSFYPDIVILDINMPKITGIEVLKQIKNSTHKKLPVIMLTNSIRSKDMTTCYEYQACGFIQKSVDLAEFYNDIEKIVSYWSELIVFPISKQA
jgi:CheY-like chemotaxis protein/DNA-binding XRE family transcriptional regulator